MGRFEILAYHQWCVLYEGYKFRDVTDITGEAKWGSYMEDPLPGAKLHKLKPLWVSGEALVSAKRELIPPMSDKEPPLLVFHADHNMEAFKLPKVKMKWERVLHDY